MTRESCEICGTVYTNERNLNRHLRNQHFIYPYVYTSNKTIKCCMCYSMYARMATLRQHIEKIHGESVVFLRINEIQQTQLFLPPEWKYSVTAKPRGILAMFILRKDECIKSWIRRYGDLNKTIWRIYSVKEKFGKRVEFYKCNHNMKKGHEGKKHNQHTSCPARLIFTQRVQHQSDMRLWIVEDHKHEINGAATLQYHDPLPEVKEKFTLMFRSKMTPMRALRIHKADLEIEYGDEYHLVAEDRKHMPDKQWMNRLCNKIRKEIHDASKGPEMLQCLKQSIEEFNNANSCISAKFERCNDNDFVVSILTPFMRRIHEMGSSGEIMFVDASHNLDRYGCKVFLLMTYSFAGGVPLGCCITNSEKEDTLYRALMLYRTMLTPSCFGGRGVLGPRVIMTDDSTSEKSALQKCFGYSVLILRIFHVLQTAWRYVRNTSIGVDTKDRQHLYAYIKKMMYAESPQKLESIYRDCKGDPICRSYGQFITYLESLYNRRSEWALFYRKKLLTKLPNTNNMCEVVVNVLCMLEGVNAFSPVQLFHFIVNELDEIYIHWILALAAEKPEEYLKKRFPRTMDKRTNFSHRLLSTNINEIKNLDQGMVYETDVELGICSCLLGETGAPCEHQVYLCNVLGKSLPLVLPISENDKLEAHYLATGTQKVCPGWHNSLMLENAPTDVVEDAGSCSSSSTSGGSILRVEEGNTQNTEIEPLTDVEEARFSFMIEDIMKEIRTNQEMRKAGLRFLNSYEHLRNIDAKVTAFTTFGTNI